MEEYIKILLEQIRCKKACPKIEEEIRSHIEEQAKANMEEGMEEEEALKAAVLDMGDPVETGVALDGIHKPQIAWDMILLIAFISLISIAIHIVIGMGAEEIGSQSRHRYVMQSIGYVGIGFLLMLRVYRLDYSILGKYGKLCALGFLAGALLLTWSMVTSAHLVVGTTSVNGQMYLNMGAMLFSPKHLAFLYVPVYGAVLFQYRKTGWKGVIGALLFLVVPVWFVWHIPCVSTAIQLLLILSVMLSAAVIKDWFLIPKKIFLGIYWGIMIFLPVMMVFLAAGGMFGAGKPDVAGHLPNYYSDYILTFLSGCYGIAAACGICLLLCVLAARAFRIALLQRNQLGMMIGLGCSLTLFTNTAVNIAENFSLLPAMESYLPFFSHNGSGIIVSYILIGFVLSVYRYKNIPLAVSARPHRLLRGWRKEQC